MSEKRATKTAAKYVGHSTRSRAAKLERDEELKDFILSGPPLPTDEAGRLVFHFDCEGYREVTVREVGPGCWRIKARPRESLNSDTDAQRDARRIVRRMGHKLLSPGVAARVGTRWATFVVLLMPEGGVFPPNEMLLPERYRHAPPGEAED